MQNKQLTHVRKQCPRDIELSLTELGECHVSDRLAADLKDPTGREINDSDSEWLTYAQVYTRCCSRNIEAREKPVIELNTCMADEYRSNIVWRQRHNWWLINDFTLWLHPPTISHRQWPVSSSSSSFPIMHIPQSWVMSCMADVHEVQEANDKSKFHRQIKTCWGAR